MRILEIRFKNLNSLAGQWRIDLQAPDYAANGLFAITGPTGAGKTTILDAMCLALYGQTPRLKKVSKGENEIMSRHTGECFAEVVFETAAGRFRCRWSQHRAGKKAGGALQNPRHEFCKHETGEIFDTKIREVAAQVETVTGMNFERFTRSMLLAQGDFSAFLQASPSERAPILEQITGTAIYSDISIRVHERKTQENAALQVLRADMAGISLLSAEEASELENALASKKEEATALGAEHETTKQALAWLDGMAALQKDIDALNGEAAHLHEAKAAFAPQRERLERARRAFELEGQHATLDALRKQQDADTADLQAQQTRLPDLEKENRELACQMDAATQATATAKAALESAKPALKAMRALDEQIRHARTELADAERDGRKFRDELEAAEQILNEAREEHRKALEQVERADIWLRDNARDAWLVSGFAGLRVQLGNLADGQQKLQEKRVERDNAASGAQRAATALATCQQQMDACQQELERATQLVQQGQAALERLLLGRTRQDYQREKDDLLKDMVRHAAIADLTEHRARLRDNDPCPLCGATAHPWATGNVPSASLTEQRLQIVEQILADIGKLENQNTILKETEQQARFALANADGQRQQAIGENERAVQTLATSDGEVAKLREELATLRAAIGEQLAPLGLTLNPASPDIVAPGVDASDALPAVDTAALISLLQRRLDSWQEQGKRAEALHKSVQDMGTAIESQDSIVAEKRKALEHRRQDYERRRQTYFQVEQQRREQYGETNADNEEQRLSQAIIQAEQAEKALGHTCDTAKQRLATANDRIATLQQTLAQRAPALQAQEDKFASALADKGFVREEDFLANSLPAEERDALATQERELDERQTALQTRQDERRTRLAAEQAKQLTHQTAAELAIVEQTQSDALRSMQENIATITQQLRAHSEARARLAERETAIAAQQRECARWENLHDLIGSADGKKFRNFAQGLTFDIMVGHANRQLQKMSDRYILVRDEKQPLELNVLDNYQAGERRSTRNLSGGETFMVSLALALGLSHMSSRNVRLDSLFLDEGFGTLDENTLDTALNTLAALQQDGKLIGVISHVPALVERIPVQIRITPQTGGRSRIDGPGCGPDNGPKDNK